ncbi:MAG: ATP-binding protein [Lautropia sp.]
MALDRAPIVALLGPRQVGKTTLARQFVPIDSPNYFDLEDPRSLARLQTPQLALEALSGLVVIDEVQRQPELFPLLRVLVDRPGADARFLILGSASPALLRQTSESLAGRIEAIEMNPFSLEEVGRDAQFRLWVRGGFPRAWRAKDDASASRWCHEFIQTFVERDLPQLGARMPPTSMRRFWTMLAHYHGGVLNGAELSRALGVSQPTVRSWLDWLTDTYMVRQLAPWHENLGKRQVKAPKIYLRDSGLLHALLGLSGPLALESHPKVGASWEGFALEQTLRHAQPDTAWSWGTHGGAELDLLMMRGERRVGIEFKRTDGPVMTRSMHVALADLKLDALYVVYPGALRYPLADRVEAVPLTALVSDPADSPASR